MTAFRTAAVALVAVLGLTLAACDAADPAAAPSVLAPSAFAFDQSFPNASAGARADAGFNHANAIIRVGVVTFAVGLNLVVPSVATEAATQVTPVVEDGTWIWENTVPAEGSTITFRLEGTPDGTEIDWRMRISSGDLQEEVYDDFTLYTATTSLDGRSGEWHLSYLIDGVPTEVLDAVYEETTATAREITFSVPETNPDVEARGSSVRYWADGDLRLFDWREPTPGQTHLIEWDAATRAGSITAWNYNDGARACWDENLDDAPCIPS